MSLAMGMIGGCADSRGGPIPYNVSDFGKPDSPTANVLPADYQIAPMDTLAVSIYGVEDLSRDYIVDLMGNMSVPLIGDVPAAGRTPNQLKQLLAARLSEKYFENPDVTVAIKSSAGRNVTVDGAVDRAGAVPALGPMTLMQAVALAGGTRDDANARRVAVFRTIDGQRQAAAFDLVSIRRGEMPDPPVYAGDIIVVDGSAVKATLRQILQTMPIIGMFRPVLL